MRLGLSNLKLMRIEAGYFLEYLLPFGALSALHVYFPDPWPKRKQRKNRLIGPGFVEAACRALVGGGTVYLRTDDPDYFQQMRFVFEENRSFRQMETPVELAGILTDFERQFHRRGIATLRTAYRLEAKTDTRSLAPIQPVSG